MLPVPPTPALASSAVNASGALESFVPPVEDWFTPVTAATSSHSCQNGGSCGCGGTCKGEKTLQVPPPVDLRTSPEVQARYMQRASPLIVGNSTLMNCVTTDGEFLSSVAKVNADLSITLSVSETRNGEVRLLANFVPTPSSGWVARNANGAVTIPYSAGISLDSFALAGLASSVVAGIAKPKLQANAGKQRSGEGVEMFRKCPCIDHDLVCTPASGKQTDNWPWTSDHRHIQWWAPCIGSFTTDISECCFNHDIALWCAHSQGDFPGINATAEACVMAKVIANAYATLSSKLCGPWWLRIIEADICYPLITSWLVAIDWSLFVLVDLAFTAAELFMASDLTNFDYSHDCSCLCGGSMPTTQCSDATGFTNFTDCTDICQLYGPSKGKYESCYKCGWVCEYDGNGNSSKVFDDGTDTNLNPAGLPCCPGTAESCNPPKGDPCPTCAQCGWYCDCDKKTGKWYESYDVFFPGSDEDVRSTGVPCCNGQDWKNPPPDPHYNCAQFDGIPCG